MPARPLASVAPTPPSVSPALIVSMPMVISVVRTDPLTEVVEITRRLPERSPRLATWTVPWVILTSFSWSPVAKLTTWSGVVRPVLTVSSTAWPSVLMRSVAAAFSVTAPLKPLRLAVPLASSAKPVVVAPSVSTRPSETLLSASPALALLKLTLAFAAPINRVPGGCATARESPSVLAPSAVPARLAAPSSRNCPGWPATASTVTLPWPNSASKARVSACCCCVALSPVSVAVAAQSAAPVAFTRTISAGAPSASTRSRLRASASCTSGTAWPASAPWKAMSQPPSARVTRTLPAPTSCSSAACTALAVSPAACNGTLTLPWKASAKLLAPGSKARCCTADDVVPGVTVASVAIGAGVRLVVTCIAGMTCPTAAPPNATRQAPSVASNVTTTVAPVLAKLAPLALVAASTAACTAAGVACRSIGAVV